MGGSLSYEILSYKDGNWKIETVCDNKADALAQARDILESRHSRAVKVIEEKYDEETDTSLSKIVFKEEKGVDKPKKKHPPKKAAPEKVERPHKVPHKKKPTGGSTIGHIIKLVVILGGILFGLIILIQMYISLGK